MTDKRIERTSSSIIALRNLLKDVCEQPEAFEENKDLLHALKSQNGLAKYTNSELGIRASCINTLKRVSGVVLEGGFIELDNLRKGALVRLDDLAHRKKMSNKKNRAGLAKRVDELEELMLTLEGTNFLLVQAIIEVISGIKSVASIDDKAARNHRAQELTRKLISLISMRSISKSQQSTQSNVVQLVPRVD